eukprot:g2094.t1
MNGFDDNLHGLEREWAGWSNLLTEKDDEKDIRTNEVAEAGEDVSSARYQIGDYEDHLLETGTSSQISRTIFQDGGEKKYVNSKTPWEAPMTEAEYDDMVANIPQPVIKRGPKSMNCGPKGVIEDFKEYCEEKKVERAIKKHQTEEMLERMTLGVVSDTPSVSLNAQLAEQARLQKLKELEEEQAENEDDDEDWLQEDEEDQKILQTYTERRQASVLENASSRITFGSLRIIDK